MSESIISSNKIYKITLSNGYEFEEGDDTATVFNKADGYGAITLTSYQIPEDYAFGLETELRDFATSVGSENIDSSKLPITVGSYAFSEFVAEGRYWEMWAFFKNNYAVFASYNCDEKDQDRERNKINEIMQSLKILH